MSAAVVAQEPLLVRIRRETQDVHQRLESELNLLAPGLTESRYCDLLVRLYGFYVPWENCLQPWVEKFAVLGCDLPTRTPELARDLRFFSIDPANVPVCPFVPRVTTLAEALGNFYVREGASLGGQVISRHLQTVLNLSGGNGYRFFSSDGRAVGKQWKQFLQVLLDQSSSENEEAITSAAVVAFEAIRCWLCSRQV